MNNNKAIFLVVVIATLNVPLGTWILNFNSPELLLGLSSDFWAGALLSANLGVMWLLIFFFSSKPSTVIVNDANSLKSSPQPIEDAVDYSESDALTAPEKDGYWFYFDYDDMDIVFHRSTFLGNETVYINDNPVSELNNIFGLKKSHNILYKGKKFKLVSEFIDLIGYKLECVLYVEKRKHSRETKGLIVGGAKDAFRQICFTIGLGLLCGLVIGGLVYLGFYFAS